MRHIITLRLIGSFCLPVFAHEKPYEHQHVQKKDGTVFSMFLKRSSSAIWREPTTSAYGDLSLC